jgi:hypothetical protein
VQDKIQCVGKVNVPPLTDIFRVVIYFKISHLTTNNSTGPVVTKEIESMVGGQADRFLNSTPSVPKYKAPKLESGFL